MNICIPIVEDNGPQSEIFDHFGSAPFFMIVETETGEQHAIKNENMHHSHGMCQPIAALADKNVDGVVVRSIGKGALSKLRAGNIQVFLARTSTVGEAVAAFKAGTLKRATPANACAHHGRGMRGQRSSEPRGQRRWQNRR